MEHTNNGVPLFNEKNYALWSVRMELYIYILAQEYNILDILENSYISPSSLPTDEKVRNLSRMMSKPRIPL